MASCRTYYVDDAAAVTWSAPPQTARSRWPLPTARRAVGRSTAASTPSQTRHSFLCDQGRTSSRFSRLQLFHRARGPYASVCDAHQQEDQREEKKRNKEKQNKKRTLAGPCGDAVVRRWDTLALMNCMCSKKRRPKDGDIYLPREFSLPSTLVRSSFLFILIFFSSSVLLRRAPWPALPRCARTHARTLDEMLHLHMQMDYAGVTRMDVCVTWRRGADVSTLTSFLF